ncbi:MarP family serine protease [Gordonia sp. L191]|uniref:MarP family serine protease n=1 Tax=Gordonia TaxID=2053 RepID=UPI001AD79DEF|nr:MULTISPECIES: MarP family serine protease [Gordonia]QTI70170.1 MarP family serine protease [Gordonia polyisoprenivorans]WHU46282.1 MarP family serine protease [Gordonia sp. L191]
MSGSTWVDIIVVAVALIAAISGFRQGAVASALAVLGVLLGAFAGILLVPHVISRIDDPTMQLVAAVGVLVALVVIGEIAGMILGHAARGGIRSPELRAIDSGVGLVLQALAALVAMWLIGTLLASSHSQALTKAVDGSKVLGAVDDAAPGWLAAKPVDEFRRLLEDSKLDGVIPTTNAGQVAPPDPALLDLPVVAQTEPSVVKIEGEAPNCQQALEGSGFVVGPDLIMTNAHVVAGTSTLQAQQSDGTSYDADVVLFDSVNDVAILRVDGIDARPLRFASKTASTGDDAIVLGYPQAGPFQKTAVRVRDMRQLPTANIYRNRQVTREVYTVRGVIRQGNSGGPMLNSAGEVLGVVFATSENAADETGYVLTAALVQKDLARAQGRYGRVSTGACVRE